MSAMVSTSGSTVSIHLTGDFDFSTQDELSAAFNQALESEQGAIEIDMKQVTFIDSSVIRMFLKLNESARKQKKSLAIRNCNEHIHEIFSIGGFDKIFDVQ
jgi:anti-anti-sigma factor